MDDISDSFLVPEQGWRGACRDGCRKARCWWRESTDPVILNSPWLRRDMGKTLCVVWIILQLLVWFLQFDQWLCMRSTVLLPWFGAMFLSLIVSLLLISLCISVCKKNKGLCCQVLVTFTFSLNASLQAMDTSSLISDLQSIVSAGLLLCHFDLHPIQLLLLLAFGVAVGVDEMDRKYTNPWVHLHFRASQLHAMCFLLLMMCGFAWDFTARVKAVSTGILFGISGDDAMASPVAGRSARKCCWLMALNNWALWASTLYISWWRHSKTSDHSEAIWPSGGAIWFILPSVIIFPSVLLVVRENCTAFQADVALALWSCTPSILLMLHTQYLEAEVASSSSDISMRELQNLQMFLILHSSGFMAVLMTIHTLVQAGCEPVPFVLTLVVLTVCLIYLYVLDRNSYLGYLRVTMFTMSWCFLNPLGTVVLCWMLTGSHAVDFFVRMRAIREGIEQSRQNAESSASYLRRLDAGGSSHGVQLPLWEPCQDDCSPQSPASSNHRFVSKENSTGSFGVSVGVVRHGERADSSFDDWCLSEDAAMYPHDPPLTAKGIQQSQKLAMSLEEQGFKFGVIITSPYLRCVQTALVLAKHFKTDLLLDQELAEVHGPPILEHEPPQPPRPWVSLIDSLKQSVEMEGWDLNAIKAKRFLGQPPSWPEPLQGARLRYTKRFLDYMRRARHTKKSCLLVTHGYMLQACASILPQNQHLQVVSTDFAAAFVATCHRADQTQKGQMESRASVPRTRTQSHTPNDVAEQDFHEHSMPRNMSMSHELIDGQKELFDGNVLIQQSKLKYWRVWSEGLRYYKERKEINGSVLEKFQSYQHILGLSWRDIVKLLGALPECPTSEATAPGRQANEDSKSLCSESASSFSTNTHTASSMAAFRNAEAFAADLEQNPELFGEPLRRTSKSSTETGGSRPKSLIQTCLAGSSLSERRKFSKERSQSTSTPAALSTKQPNHENHEMV